MKQINDTTFISDNLGELKPLVTIGGKPVDKFIPNLNMSFHDDEFFINLNRRNKQAISATDKAEIDGIDKDIFYIDSDGRFKWDIEFKERPSKNSWTWELKHTDGIEFYFQGELTAEEIAEGHVRTDEVVGSYAVYCGRKNNKYKTGKLCHIYRPYCYDANGNHVYADLNISDNSLTITIPQEYLDNAVYPVRLDPTIGYSSVGASSGGFTTRMYTTLSLPSGDLQADSSGTCSSIFVYSTSATNTIEVGAYDGSSPRNRIATTGSITSGWSANAWRELSVTSFDIVSGNYYYPAFASTGTANMAYDTTATAMTSREAYTSLQATSSTAADRTYVFSLYLSYTESGGGSLPSIINNYRQQGVM